MTSTSTLIRMLGKDTTPGPGAYMPPSDFGKAPAFSIRKKLTEKTYVNDAGYQNLPSTVGQGRKSSLYSRHDLKDKNITPGPTYVPPRFGSDGHTSAFHMRTRRSEPGPVSPGPGAYDNRSSSSIGSGPRFTLKARLFPPEEGKNEGPGSGAYMPDYDAVYSTQKKTIGAKHNDLKTFQTPGPGQYEIDRRLKGGPISFHMRPKEVINNNNPGPGKYDTSVPIGKDSLRFSLRSRIDVEKKPIDAEYQKIPDVFGTEGIKATFHSRHKDLHDINKVGPDYVPPPFGSDATKCALYSRRETTNRSTPMITPGAGTYNTRTEPGSDTPKFTLKARKFPPQEGENVGPGPAKNAPDYSKILGNGRRTQILEKIKDPKPPVTPGYYDVAPISDGPKWTIGRKEYLETTPGSV